MLTKTEIQVLQSIAAGMSTRAIAAERRRSMHTVNNHKRSILRKLGRSTAAGAVAEAFRQGLIF